MTGSVNKVILIGTLGRDPEVKTFQSGGRVVNLSIATNERWKDRNTGERKDRTEWHKVAIFADKVGEIAERYLKKGSQCMIEGKLETRKWQDQSGSDRYSTEIAVRSFGGQLVLLDKREGGGSSGGQQQERRTQQRQEPEPVKQEADPFAGFGEDTDVPF